MIRVWSRLSAVLLAVLLTAVCARAAHARPLVVLLTTAENTEWANARLEGVRAAIGGDVVLELERVGFGRLYDPEQTELLRALLRSKYANVAPAAVAALDEDAAALLADSRQTLFPDAPAVYSLRAVRGVSPPAGRIWAGGVLEELDIAGTMAAIDALQPNLLRLVAINGDADTPNARAASAEMRKLVRAAVPSGVEFAYWENVATPILTERLRSLSSRDAVLLLSHDKPLFDAEIARSLKLPIYSVWEEHGDRWVVGGCAARAEDYGRALGGLLRAVLQGRRDIGVAPSPAPACVFDAGRLAELDVKSAALPATSILVNQPKTGLPDYNAFPAFYYAAGLAAFGLAAIVAALSLRVTERRIFSQEADKLARLRFESVAVFQESLDELRDCVFLIDEETLRFSYGNRGAQEHLGYSLDDLKTLTLMDVNAEIEPAHLESMLVAMRRGDRVARRFQTSHRRRGGAVLPVDIHIQHVAGRDGRAGRFVLTARDITEIRAVEAALRAEAQRLELALTASADGVWDWDVVTDHIWFSPRWKEQLGYTDSELDNTLDTWRRLIHPDDLVRALQLAGDFNEGRSPAFDVVLRYRHKSGRIVYIHSRAAHYKDASGKVVRMVGAHTDITERQIAQIRLQESEGRLRELAAAVPGMMFQWIERREGGHNFVWVSPRARELFGVEPSRLIEDWTQLRIHPDDLDMWRVSLETSALTGVDWEFEGRILRDDGLARWIKGLARPESTPDGVLLNGIFLDITDEHLLREEMDRLRNRLDFLLNASPAIICATSADERMRPNFLSAGIHQFGYRARELLDEPDWWAVRIHPDDRAAVIKSTASLMEGDALELSYRFRTSDGDWRWVVDHRVLVRDGEGRALEVVGTMTDVSRVVEAEQRARQTQERLELVLQSAGEGIYGVDQKGFITFANAAALRMTGLDEADLRTAPSHALFHHSHEDGSYYPEGACPVHRTLVDGVVRHVTDEVFWRKGGDCFPVEYVAAPLRDAGRLTGAVVVFRDVTEARRVRGELQNSLRRWEAVLSNSPVGIALTDRNRRFVRINGYLSSLLGAPPEELIGRSVRIVYPSDQAYQDMAERAYPAVMRGEVHQEELQLRRVTGETVWVSVTGSLIDADDPDQGGVWVLEDISQRKAQEIALRDKTRDLERSNTELEAFAYVASHDLRQPLRVVNSYLSLLERSLGASLSGDAKEFINFARSGALRMDRLIVDLLEYSRVGRRSKPHARLKCADLVANALRTLEFAIDDVGGEVTVVGDLPEVDGDESELERLFQNVIGNALKYHAKDRPPKVTVVVEAVDGGWLFAITDNGIGIPESQLERVFGIFQRLHAPDAYEGSGIGLAICRKIVERHGGRIWVESTEGVGSAFKFVLPAVTA